jgi:ABC-2 type transport system permease protein
MRWNPIFRKEIVTDSRGSRLPGVIFLFNLILTVAAMVNLFHMTGQAMDTAEIQYSSILELYSLICSLEFVMLLIIMPALTAPAVCGEKERQTFDLLMTTPLKPRSFILGKLAASETEMMILLLSALPVQSLVFIFGGVTGADFLLLFLTYAAAVTYIGAIGIMSSVIFRRSVAANAAAYTVTALLTAGTAVLYRFLGNISGGAAGGIPVLLLFNPAVTFFCVINGLTGTGNTLTALALFSWTSPQNVLTDHWVGLSILLQVLSAAVLIALSVRLVVPGRTAASRRRKRGRGRGGVQS